MLQLYNTRTRVVEPFAPLEPPNVRIYVCGLTPSAEAHIGHARTYLFFDVLRRYFKHLGYNVFYAQNVTDVDDRSILRAKEMHEDWRTIVGAHYASFKSSMRRLGVLEPDAEPRATQYVPQMVEMIAALIERRHAYVARDGVYYSVSTFRRYGELSNRNLDDLEAGARVEVDEAKKDPLDFALWKFAKPGEPAWPSPWGNGRPGWHIECSAMSREIVDPRGAGFDIHGAGADLIFPHHENEIAQSEPLMQRPPMANFWLHGGLLLFDSRKMSKSLGNFEPLYELLKRHDPQAIRLLFLQTGYRKVMNFTEESIGSAAAALDRLKGAWRNAVAHVSEGGGTLMPRIEAALNDDFNTSQALAEVFTYAGGSSVARAELAAALEILGIAPQPSWDREAARTLPADFVAQLKAQLPNVALDGETPDAAIAQVLRLRDRARANRDWETSDRLRQALLRCGVAVNDTADGSTWTVAG